MKKTTTKVAYLLFASVWFVTQFTVAAPKVDNKYLGKWSGTFSGQDTSGHIDLSLERNRQGVVTGTIVVKANPGQGFDYTATFKNTSFVGPNFTAVYDPRGDGQTEITLKGVFNPTAAEGDWTARASPTGDPVAAGNWKIAKSGP